MSTTQTHGSKKNRPEIKDEKRSTLGRSSSVVHTKRNSQERGLSKTESARSFQELEKAKLYEQLEEKFNISDLFDFTEMTLPKLIKVSCLRHRNLIAYQTCIGTDYDNKNPDNFFTFKKLTFRRMYRRIIRFAKGILAFKKANNITRQVRIAFFSPNCSEYTIGFFGCLLSGNIPTTIPIHFERPQISLILSKFKPDIAFCGKKDYVDFMKSITNSFPIISFPGFDEQDLDEETITRNSEAFYYFLFQGESIDDEELEEIAGRGEVGDTAMIMYTITPNDVSGFRYSHKNIIFSACAVINALELQDETEVFASHRPFSDFIAQQFDFFIALIIGATVYVSPDFSTATSRLLTFLRVVRPTLFGTTPRFWNVLRKTRIAEGPKGMERIFGKWSRSLGSKSAKMQSEGKKMSFGYSIAKSVFFEKAHAELGLERGHTLLCFGKLSAECISFFASNSVLISEVLSLEECAGVVCLPKPGRVRPGLFGTSVHPLVILFANDGELCVRGPTVFIGINESEDPHTMVRSGLECSFVEISKPDKENSSVGTDEKIKGAIGLKSEYVLNIARSRTNIVRSSNYERIDVGLIEGMLNHIDVIQKSIVIAYERAFVSALLIFDLVGVRKRFPKLGLVNPRETADDRDLNRYLQEQIRFVSDNLPLTWEIKFFGIISPTTKLEVFLRNINISAENRDNLIATRLAKTVSQIIPTEDQLKRFAAEVKANKEMMKRSNSSAEISKMYEDNFYEEVDTPQTERNERVVDRKSHKKHHHHHNQNEKLENIELNERRERKTRREHRDKRQNTGNDSFSPEKRDSDGITRKHKKNESIGKNVAQQQFERIVSPNYERNTSPQIEKILSSPRFEKKASTPRHEKRVSSPRIEKRVTSPHHDRILSPHHDRIGSPKNERKTIAPLPEKGSVLRHGNGEYTPRGENRPALSLSRNKDHI